jgi:hypothetical protein
MMQPTPVETAIVMPENRLGLDRLADSAEKGLAVPMCIVRVREPAFAV